MPFLEAGASSKQLLLATTSQDVPVGAKSMLGTQEVSGRVEQTAIPGVRFEAQRPNAKCPMPDPGPQRCLDPRVQGPRGLI